MSQNTVLEKKILTLIAEVDPDKLYNDIHFDFIGSKGNVWARNSLGDIISLEPVDKTLSGDFDRPTEGCLTAPDKSRFRYSARFCDRKYMLQLFVRRLPAHIPDMESLGYSEYKRLLDGIDSGLVLVSGTTGSGKSTVMASLSKARAQDDGIHIVTVEDPIEYVYPMGLHVSQREVGVDTPSFADGLVAALREDPDLIMVGEIRDKETAETAMTAAETGHLVLATVHSPSNAGSVQRMLALLGGDDYGSLRLSQGLKLCIHVTRRGYNRTLDVLKINDALSNVIRESKLHQINSVAEQVSKKAS